MIEIGIITEIMMVGIPSLFSLNYLTIKKYSLYRGKLIKSIINGDDHLSEVVRQNIKFFGIKNVNKNSRAGLFQNWYLSKDAKTKRCFLAQEISERYKLKVSMRDLYYAFFEINVDRQKLIYSKDKVRFLDLSNYKKLENRYMVSVDEKSINHRVVKELIDKVKTIENKENEHVNKHLKPYIQRYKTATFSNNRRLDSKELENEFLKTFVKQRTDHIRSKF